MPRRRRRSAQFNLIRWLLGFRLVRITLILTVGGVVLGLADAVAVSAIASGAIASVLFLAIYATVVLLIGYVWLRGSARRWRRVKAYGELLALTPSQFEEAVAGILQQLGYRDVQRIGGSGDLAADIQCRDRKGKRVVVQCKRHAPGIRVGSGDVQTFIGMMSVHHAADRGIFVTTSEFTRPASDLARHHAIMLLDGPGLTRILGRLNDRQEPEVGPDSNSTSADPT